VWTPAHVKLIKRAATYPEVDRVFVHPAIKKADAEGKATNRLEIDAKQDPSNVRFKVNGQTVHTIDAKTMDAKGIVGLRVNHNLDVHIEGFEVHK
jgi:hypothetical protein